MDSYAPSLPPRSARPSASPPVDGPAVTSAPLIEGPRWYRSRIRLLGAFAALIVPAIVGAIAIGSLRLFDGALSGAIGLFAGVMAAPGLLVVGAPFGDKSLYPLGIAGSAVMWMLIGVLAARRATRNPMATWSDYWRQYAWLCAGIWIGCLAALIIAAMVVGESLY